MEGLPQAEDFEIFEVNNTRRLVTENTLICTYIYSTKRCQRITCPNALCNREFVSIHSITEHLNSPESLCSRDLSQEQAHLRLPPSLRQPQIDTMVDTHCQRTAQYHALSGATHGKSKNLLQQMEDDPNQKYRVHNAYYPFAGAAEWSLTKFLAENLTQAQINRFLKLRWVLP